MVKYNPFNKNISEIEYSDLQKLVDERISEGWYIEYKGDFPKNNKNIAKSIASFANSEGGWYIIGIEEETGTNNPKKIPGFFLNHKTENSKEKIANIIKDRITPLPYFESKLISLKKEYIYGRGLQYSLPLKYVLVVLIHEGNDPPYISDGNIQIRVGESSGPEPLKDRYMYEKLLEKSKTKKLKLENFCKDKLTYSNSQSQTDIFLEFYVFLNNSKFRFKDFHSKNFFENIKNHFNKEIEIIPSPDDNKAFSGNITFKNILPSYNSYILRNKSSTNVYNNIELFNDGNFKLLMNLPILSQKNSNSNRLNFYPYDSESSYKSFNKDLYDYFGEFLNKFDKDDKKVLQIIDANEFIPSFIIIVNLYKKLLKDHNYDDELLIRIKLRNCWRTVLFFDNIEYINYIEKNDLPICLKNEIELPEFTNFNHFIYNIKDLESWIFIHFILEALGFPLIHEVEFYIESLRDFVFKKMNLTVQK